MQDWYPAPVNPGGEAGLDEETKKRSGPNKLYIYLLFNILKVNVRLPAFVANARLSFCFSK